MNQRKDEVLFETWQWVTFWLIITLIIFILIFSRYTITELIKNRALIEQEYQQCLMAREIESTACKEIKKQRLKGGFKEFLSNF